MRSRFGINRVAALFVLGILILSCPAAGDDAAGVVAKVRAWREAREVAIAREFADLLSIPCVASDLPNIRLNAQHILAMMTELGIDARLLEIPGVPPVVYGELRTPGATKTVAVYVHYDGQPVVPEKWTGDPWTPELRNQRVEDGGEVIPWEGLEGPLNGEWRLYGRGSGDDKAPVMTWLKALEALRAADIPLSVNVKFFFEGEEEAGSPHLAEILTKYSDLLETDLLFVCDGPVHQSRRPQLFFGVRGIAGFEMTVYGPDTALHSGHYGNWAPNPGALLANLLASMRDSDGRILIEGINERVPPLSDADREALSTVPDPDEELRAYLGLAATEANNARLAERIMLPALNIKGLLCGAVGERAKNAVPTEAIATIGYRLVPDLDPDIVRELTEAHIRKQGYHIVYEDPDEATRLKYFPIVKLEWEGGYAPARTPVDLPASQAVIGLIEDATDDPLVVMPVLGGSLPLYLFKEHFKAPVVGLPMANHDNNQHGPNENLRLQNLWDSIEINAAILALLGERWEAIEK